MINDKLLQNPCEKEIYFSILLIKCINILTECNVLRHLIACSFFL